MIYITDGFEFYLPRGSEKLYFYFHIFQRIEHSASLTFNASLVCMKMELERRELRKKGNPLFVLYPQML